MSGVSAEVLAGWLGERSGRESDRRRNLVKRNDAEKRQSEVSARESLPPKKPRSNGQ
jgi:hypothetical protein